MSDGDPEVGSSIDPGPEPPADDHWVNRWRIDHRLVLAVGLPIVLFLAGAVFVGVQVDEFGDLHEQEAEERSELEATVELERGFSDVIGASRTYVITGDTQNRSRLESRIATFEDQLGNYEPPVEDDRQGSFTAFEENATASIEIVRQAQGEVEEGNMENAQELVTSPRADRIRTDALSAIDTLVTAEQRDVEQERASLASARSDLDRTLVLGTLAILVVTGIVGYDIARHTRSRMEWMSATMEDRLAQLQDARETERRHLDAQARALEKARDRLGATQNTCGTLHRHLDDTIESVRTIRRAVEEGTASAQGTLSGYEETDAHVNTVTERLLDIGEEVDNLENLADEVEDIAGQIDMLALNASVEASRTGGDAPGLNEVRDLAERSQARAQRLQEVSEVAREESEAAAMALEQSGKAIHENREGTNDVVDTLARAEDEAEEGLEETRELRERTDEQLDALKEVEEILVEARREAEQARRANEQAEQLVQDLEAVSQQIRRIR